MAVATGRPLPPELLASVHSQTEGNPLFLAEITRFLVQEGVLDPASPAARARVREGMALRRIPEGVKEVIGTRLNRLSNQCNAVLANAAAVGRTFSVEVLGALLDGVSEDQLLSSLEEALAAAVLEQAAEPGSYQFSHALIRETLYDEIPAIRRRAAASPDRRHAGGAVTGGELDVAPLRPRSSLLRGAAGWRCAQSD